MTATDSTFESGQVGVGSFDDTGNFDDVFLSVRRSNRRKSRPRTSKLTHREEADTGRHPAEGFVLFNGKDLTGWKDSSAIQSRRAAMKPEELAEAQAKADRVMRESLETSKMACCCMTERGAESARPRTTATSSSGVTGRSNQRGQRPLHEHQIQIWDTEDEA